jgi:hypothetical protein
MRKLITLSALAAVVVFGWLMSRSSAAPAPADKPVRWEYAELHYRGPSFPGPGQPAQPPTIEWITTDEEIGGNSWDDLAAKLKAPAARKEANTMTHKLRVFNQLGADGWELVEHHGAWGLSSVNGEWMFKRRAP